MIFSTSLFIFIFLPIVLLLYYLAEYKFKNFVLLIASLIFYAWGEPKNILIILLLIITNYFIGLGLGKNNLNNLQRRFLLIIAVLVDLGVLFHYKYYDFLVNTVNQIFKCSLGLKNTALPIGLSFFTFQILSYIIDVYRKEVPAQRKIQKLTLYILLFPQLIAGPIVRYFDIEEQLSQRKINYCSFYEGSKRFMIGFSKKVLIADIVGQVADIAFNNQMRGTLAWLGMVAYTLQIYYDFSGYSDMAIGMGRMFGFKFNENFQYPYSSLSVKEFWRRWHISLSTWFRDYLYIPLGGSRCKKIKTYVNLIIVFFCTGLWHGANWNFIFWGLYYAVILIAERIMFGEKKIKLPKVVAWVYTVFLVMIGWVFFRSNSIKSAVEYIGNLFVFTGDEWKCIVYYMDREKISTLLMGIIFSFPIYPYMKNKLDNYKISGLIDGTVCVIFVLAIFYMVGNSYSPFLYFRF